jgi:hypothetical protein
LLLLELLLELLLLLLLLLHELELELELGKFMLLLLTIEALVDDALILGAPLLLHELLLHESQRLLHEQELEKSLHRSKVSCICKVDAGAGGGNDVCCSVVL